MWLLINTWIPEAYYYFSKVNKNSRSHRSYMTAVDIVATVERRPALDEVCTSYWISVNTFSIFLLYDMCIAHACALRTVGLFTKKQIANIGHDDSSIASQCVA